MALSKPSVYMLNYSILEFFGLCCSACFELPLDGSQLHLIVVQTGWCGLIEAVEIGHLGRREPMG